MGKATNSLNQSTLSVIRNFVMAQVHQKHFTKSIQQNFKRLVFYILNYSEIQKLGKLVDVFPLSSSHKFKIKFGALFGYLSRSFAFERALPVLIGNYTYVINNFSPSGISQMFSTGIECWKFDIYSITLIKSMAFDFEGSFSLIFNVGEKKIYTLSFSFVEDLNEPGSWQLYIARKQGQAGMLPEFRKTAKTFNDNKIVTMVLAAAEGLALSLGIKAMIGVGTINQLSNVHNGMEDFFAHSYDEYWRTQESIRMRNGDYFLPVPMLLKPLEKISAHHKKRTVIKRKRRAEISVSVRASIDSYRPADLLIFQPQSGAENFFKSEIFLIANASA